VFADEDVGGDAEAFVEAADHGEGEAACVVEDFGDAGAAADEGFEVAACEATLFHGEFDGLDGVWGVDGVVFFFQTSARVTRTSRRSPSGVFGRASMRESISLSTR
jgi:hypothetical protein